jgi:hypothetical protein
LIDQADSNFCGVFNFEDLRCADRNGKRVDGSGAAGGSVGEKYWKVRVVVALLNAHNYFLIVVNEFKQAV